MSLGMTTSMTMFTTQKSKSISLRADLANIEVMWILALSKRDLFEWILAWTFG